MLDASYTPEIIFSATDAFRRDGAVILSKVLREESLRTLRTRILKVKSVKNYHPLMHRMAVAQGPGVDSAVAASGLMGLLEALTGKRYTATVYHFGRGDFSLLHKEVAAESGAVAFFDASHSWKRMWGGYVGVGNDALHISPDSFVLLNMKGKRWFVKRVNHGAKEAKIILVMRESKKGIVQRRKN